MHIIGLFRLTRAIAVVVVFLLAVRSVAAHALGAECTLRGGRVEVEAYFDDDTAAVDARIIVCDEAQKVVVEGRTDAKGLWSFARPAAGLYRVTVDGGAGHRTTVRIKVPAREESPKPPVTVAGVEPAKDRTPATPAGEEVIIHEGPSRAEFTRFPWIKTTLGLTVIAALNLGWWGLCRRTCREHGGDTK
jgi:nickel transport protein